MESAIRSWPDSPGGDLWQTITTCPRGAFGPAFSARTANLAAGGPHCAYLAPGDLHQAPSLHEALLANGGLHGPPASGRRESAGESASLRRRGRLPGQEEAGRIQESDEEDVVQSDEEKGRKVESSTLRVARRTPRR